MSYGGCYENPFLAAFQGLAHGLIVVSVDLICLRIYLSFYSLIVFTVYFPLLFTDYPGPPRLALLSGEPGH